MIKVLAVIGAWIIGTGVVALACNKDTEIEPVAYAYSIGFIVALILGFWIWA